MNYDKVISILIVLSLCCISPVTGVTTYLGGSPRMSATVNGTNEFTPGQDVTLSMRIQNSGLNLQKGVMQGTIDRDDIPTTAKMVTVSMASAGAPIIIKSDPQNAGDMKSQETVTVKIAAKIRSDATLGEYQVPLTVRYTYLASSQQEASDQVQFEYRQISEILPVTIKIKPLVKIDVIQSVAENISVGTGGYLNLTIINSGFEDGKKATVKIMRSGNSPIIPTDSSVFIGDFPRNISVFCRFKISVSSEAEQQTYPVDVAVTYENRDGEVITSATDTIGVPVQNKIRFSLSSPQVQIISGSENVIAVQYQNNGETPVYNAQARLSAVDPFTSTDGSAYLGDMPPGEQATAHYKLSVETDARPQTYYLDTEVRYRDAFDNSQVSDTFKVPVEVIRTPGWDVVRNLPVLAAIACTGIGAGYYLLSMRKKK